MKQGTPRMKRGTLHRIVASAALCALGGCASIRHCGLEGCPADREITARVRVLLDQYDALEAPNRVSAQTIDRVVYLTGLVETPYQKRLASSVAAQAAGVIRVVNSIALENTR
jgi:osmotically-inducible protein OsmY